MKQSHKVTYGILALLLCIGGLAWLSEYSATPLQSSHPTQEQQEPAPVPFTPRSVRLIAAGDNLIHDVIYQQARARAGGEGYDFDAAYAQVEKLFDPEALTFINQETPLASKILPLSNYPMFNSPTEVGDKLVEMGFDAINHANNHMLDKGEKGLLATMDYWEAQPVVFIGAWRSKEEADKPIIVTKNGVDIGFVAVAEQTNGLSLPQGSPVHYLLSSDLAGIKRQVELTQAHCDYLVVSIHWGEENVFSTTPAQDALAQELADMGVDLVLGHHSHTLAPMEWLQGKEGKKTLVVYSLGNFISAMASPQNMLGGVLDMQLVEDTTTGEFTVKSAQMIPVVTHYGYRYQDLKLYPLAEYTDQLAKEHGIRGKHPNFSRGYLWEIYHKVIPKEFATA